MRYGRVAATAAAAMYTAVGTAPRAVSIGMHACMHHLAVFGALRELKGTIMLAYFCKRGHGFFSSLYNDVL